MRRILVLHTDCQLGLVTPLPKREECAVQLIQIVAARGKVAPEVAPVPDIDQPGPPICC